MEISYNTTNTETWDMYIKTLDNFLSRESVCLSACLSLSVCLSHEITFLLWKTTG